MQNPLEEQNPFSPPVAIVSTAPATQLHLGALAIFGGLVLANFVSLTLSDAVRPEQEGDIYHRFCLTLRTAALAMGKAELSLTWIWLRVHIESRATRVLCGWIGAHLIYVSWYLASVMAGRLEMNWDMFVDMGLLVYFVYLGTGLCLNFLVSRCGLGYLWAADKRSSPWGTDDLLSFAFVAAMFTGELIVFRHALPWAIDGAVILLLTGFILLCASTAIVSALALGCFYSPKSSLFIVMLGLLAMLGPTVLIGIPTALLRIGGNDVFLIANISVLSFSATLIILFPALLGSRSPSVLDRT
ncbi:MAG: hypothetical protein JNK90_23595 [Planctomycetaceae bacterium]|nr:hypothetical protein [Planctomycetaceae bacterium]